MYITIPTRIFNSYICLQYWSDEGRVRVPVHHGLDGGGEDLREAGVQGRTACGDRFVYAYHIHVYLYVHIYLCI